MINTEPDRDLIERALRFANLSEVGLESAEKVEGLFKDHPYTRTLTPDFSYFKSVIEPEGTPEQAIKGFKDLQSAFRLQLMTITNGPDAERRKVLSAAIDAFKLHSSETASVDFTLIDQEGHRRQAKIEFPLWGLPELSFKGDVRLERGHKPMVVGVHSAVSYVVILLFSMGLKDKLAVCPAPLPGKRKTFCKKFFVRTKKRWATCSDTCSLLHRRAQVNRAVLSYWKSNPRTKKKPRKGKKSKLKGGSHGTKK